MKGKQATGMRDILIHAHDEVDFDQVWTSEVSPSFAKQIGKIRNAV
jgi:uncharacterized protein with HEPN domain